MDFAIFLLFLFGLMAIVTVLGHGIWVAFSAIMRMLFYGTDASNGSTPRFCPVCGTSMHRHAQNCSECNWQVRAARSSPARIAWRYLELLKQRGLVKPTTFQEFSDAVRRDLNLPPDPTNSPDIAPLVPVLKDSLRPPPVIQSVRTPIINEEIYEGAMVEDTPFVTPAPVAPSEFDVSERARRFQEYRERHQQASQQVAASVPAPASPPVVKAPPSPPPKPWNELLAGFMEEKHIRWGELVGGMLIVSCSIALVVSFWSQIAERPLLKFGVFNGVTAALFGLGLHAAKRWKLPTTSEGILIISTLLVPLNFLAIAAFTSGGGPTDILGLVGEAISIAIFGTLVYLAARNIQSAWPATFTVAVIVPSILQLFTRRWIDGDSSLMLLYSFSLISLIVYVLSNADAVRRLAKLVASGEVTQLEATHGSHLFKMLGISSFATAIPIGLLLFKSQAILHNLHFLAPLATLLALPCLSSGLLLWRHSSRAASAWQTAGSSVAVLGSLILVGGIALAWPAPAPLLAVTGFTALLMFALGFIFRITGTQLVAASGLAIAYLLGLHLITGRLPALGTDGLQTTTALTSAFSGHVLIGCVAMFAAISAGFMKLRRSSEAILYAIASGLAAVISLLVLSWHGAGIAGDPHHVTWVYALYAIAASVAGVLGMWRRTGLKPLPSGANFAWDPLLIGGGLLGYASVVQGIVYRYGESLELSNPWFVASICTSTLFTALTVAAQFWQRRRTLPANPLGSWFSISTLTIIAAIVFLGRTSLLTHVPPAAIHLFWLAIIWRALSVALHSAVLFGLFQASLAIGLGLFVDENLRGREWYQSIEFGALHPYSLQAYGCALAMLCIVWIVIRLVAQHRLTQAKLSTESNIRPLEQLEAPQDWLYTATPVVEYGLTGFLTIVLCGLAIYSAAPGLAQELSLRSLPNLREIPPISDFQWHDVPNMAAMRIGSWAVAGLLAGVFALGIREKYHISKVSGLALLAAASCLLLAARFESQVAVASALRWFSAGGFVLGSIALWFLADRHSLRWTRDAFSGLLFVAIAPLSGIAIFLATASLGRRPPSGFDSQLLVILGVIGLIAFFVSLATRNTVVRSKLEENGASWKIGNVLLILGLSPLLAMTVYVVSASLAAHPIVGPESGSFFQRIGIGASYGLPLVFVTLAFIGHAIHQHSARLALVSGMLVNSCATTLYLLSGVGPLTSVIWMKLAQLNAIFAAVFAILWMFYLIWKRGLAILPLNATNPLNIGFRQIQPLVTQVAVAFGFLVFFMIPAVGTLILFPETPWELSGAAGLRGWLATAAVIAAIAMMFGRLQWRSLYPVAAMLLVMQTSLQMHAFDTGDWLAYHTLLLLTASMGIVLAIWEVVLLIQSQQSQRKSTMHPYVIVTWIATILLSLRATGFDPASPFWTCIGLFAAVVISSLTAVACGGRRFVYGAAALLNLTVSIWWINSGHLLLSNTFPTQSFVNFMLVNAIAFSLPAGLWRWLDMRWIANSPQIAHLRTTVGCHRVVAALGLAGYCFYVVCSLFADANSHPVPASMFLVWPALFSVIAAVAVCLWDPQSRFGAVGLYFAGLAAAATLVDVLDAPPRWLLLVGTLALAGYGFFTSYLWSRRGKLAATATRLGIPDRTIRELAGHSWLAPANLVIAAGVTLLGFASQFEFSESTLRIAAAQAILVQTLSIGMLAFGKRESSLRLVSLSIGVLGAVAFSWSFLNPETNGTLLNRLVAAAAALGIVVVFYGLGFTKILRRENDWTRSAAKLTPIVGILAIVVIALELAAEAAIYARDGSVTIAGPAVMIVAATLIGLTIALLIAAILPGRDPMNLSPSRRQVYVYAAEGLLALTFVHVRLTMPFLFTGAFQRFWPLIVMVIAFLGVGLSEFFRRRQTTVLATPLERTGALLPMLPVLGYWISPAQVHYSLLMLAVGVFYGALSAMRRSFGFGILAALAVNGGLWFLLRESEGLGVLEHPQLWLIPPSLCVLAAAYMNRKRLDEAQMATIRYLTSTVIYTASTADIFLNGVAAEPWLPMILAGLSIIGIAMGIVMRVRAFLFLGTSFLGLSLLTVIWYAAVDLHQTWLWFVVGILTGVVIIATFALFEKKRQEVIAVMERLKQWQA